MHSIGSRNELSRGGEVLGNCNKAILRCRSITEHNSIRTLVALRSVACACAPIFRTGASRVPTGFSWNCGTHFIVYGATPGYGVFKRYCPLQKPFYAKNASAMGDRPLLAHP